MAVKRSIESSPLYNQDLAPTDPARRTWGTYNFAALWISMAHCIPTYMLASGLIGAGMNWKQALLTILLGNTIVLVPILLNSHPGTKYGIPFPVFARAAYGTRGSNLPALMRALVACGWFGIQAWIGGQALNVLFRSLWPGWTHAIAGTFGGHTPTEWISFLLFWGLNILVVYRGMDLLRKVENWAAPFVLVMTAVLVWWALTQAHGLGPILAHQGKFAGWHEFWPIFVPSLTAMIGFWATLSLNMPDFTRFGRSQREQAVGQVIALPTTMTVFAAMGVVITSATRDHLRHGDLGPGRAGGKIYPAVDRRYLHVHRGGGDAVGEHRRQRGLAGQRFCQRLSAPHQLPSRRRSDRADRHRDAALEAAGGSFRLHLQMAARLFGRTGIDCRRAHRRLLDRAPAAPGS